MKHFVKDLLQITLFSACFASYSYGQDAFLKPGAYPAVHTAHATNAMNATPRNYKWFTTPFKNTDGEAIEANLAYQKNPEAGLLFPGTPCDNCYELIGKRTADSKTFLKEGTNEDGSKTIYAQTSAEDMHYKDANGNWLTVRTQLEADKAAPGVYAADKQPIPIHIHATNADNFVAIGKEAQGFKFNHNLELIYAKAGTNTSLGNADWTNATAGDDGVYVTNAWPGIDIEIYLMKGAVKTNFIINHSLPAYTDGELLIRDHFLLGNGLSLYAGGEQLHNGILEIRDADGKMKFAMSGANAAEKHDPKKTFRSLNYYIGNDNTVDIALPGDFLNRSAASYPVIIDPLVSTLTSIPIAGSTYSAAWSSGCTYTNPANTPANCTITDIQFTMEYTATGGAWISEGAFSLYLGTCRSPGTAAAGLSWSCAGFGGGTCTATPASAYSIFSDFSPCVPPPACTPYPLNITMQLYQNYLPTAACASTYVYGSQPFVVTVIGHTIELTAAGVTGTPSTICIGGTATLTGTAHYGVPPYTYSWAPTGSGSPITVSPLTTTTYTLTATDACGITITGTKTITVNTVSPITGTTSICIGTTTTLSNATTGGTWSSSTPAVATVVTGTGVVTGVATGTSVITYTAPGGCTTVVTVSVTPAPGTISGTTVICVGATTALTNSTPAGTWSSSSGAVGTVSTTGVVTGLSAGTTNITYATGPGCFAFITVTVNLLAPITGITTICVGTTTTLSDAVSGGTWSSSVPTVATISSTGLVSALSAGTTTISYNVPSGCAATVEVTVNVPTPILGNLSVCLGSTTSLSNASPIGTWSSSTTAVATIGAGTGIVTPVTVGTSNIVYTSLAGCVSNAVVTVNPLPDAITGALIVCAGSSITLSDATPGGTWSSDNTAAATIGISSGVVSGISGGTAGITFILPTGCIAATAVTVNPLPAAIAGTTTLCKGATTALSDAASGGIWASNNAAVAYIDPSSGLVSGVAAGNAMITYTLPTGCLTTIVVVVNPIPPPPATAGTNICQNANPVSPLTATAAVGGSLLWYTSLTGGPSSTTETPNVTIPGNTTYYVSQVVNGCESDRAPLVVTVHHYIPFAIQASKPFVCQHDSINLSYAGPYFPGEVFTWQLPSVATLTLGTTGDSSITARFDSSIDKNLVTLTVGDGYAPCNIIDTLPVNVALAAPLVRFYVKPDICVGDKVPVALTESGPGITDYLWNFDTAQIVSASSDHGGPFLLTWLNPGIHYVSVKAISNPACPARIEQDTVNVHAYPDPSIAPLGILNGKSQVCIGDSVLFSPLHYSDRNSYVWSPSHFFEQNNSYNTYGVVQTAGPVKLTVTDPWGCVSSAIVQINAQPCCTVFFPNAFTPGGSANTVFRPVTIGTHTVHVLRIVNRWGQTVFQAANETPSWDGTYNGVPQDLGVYYYYFEYDCSGSKHEQKGEVMLVR
jgi:gliding motility-associated-like protein